MLYNKFQAAHGFTYIAKHGPTYQQSSFISKYLKIHIFFQTGALSVADTVHCLQIWAKYVKKSVFRTCWVNWPQDILT
jgi:hypothetical protein